MTRSAHRSGRGARSVRPRTPPAWAISISVALTLALAGCGAPAEELNTAPTSAAVPATSSAPPVSRVLGEGVVPASVAIPAIDLAEPLIDLGLEPDGTMEVPDDFDEVGWFADGGRPGGRGPTVIAGHVDSPSAPAVFFRLSELQPGDRVAVTDVEGAVTEYVVDEVADYPKDAFPTARVFGAQPDDQLRLITCGGFFDADAGSYDQNRVVYASPAD